MMTPKKLDNKSIDGCQLNLEALYAIAPSCFTEVQDSQTGETKHVVNFDTLRTLLGDHAVETDHEMYQFTWPGKQTARLEAVAETTETLRPVPKDSVDWKNTQNIYIEGDNLRVLKLLQKSYLSKIKMIYIDPPYNTGNDFVYHDDFARSTQAEELAAGNIDAEGYRYRKNGDSNGRFHSDWCSMMLSRLLVAHPLLAEDGVIFISIDDNEVHNLRKICDEVFGANNFVAELIWERAFAPKNDAKYISNSHDYVLMYAKQIDSFTIGRLPRTEEANARYSNPDNDPRGVWMSSDISVKTYSAECDYPITTPSGRVVEPPAGRCWSLSAKAFAERLQDNRIWFGADGDGVPRIKRFLSELKHEGMAPTSILFYKEVGHSQEGAKELVSLFDDKGVFDGPKPLRLLTRLLTLANLNNESIVLDFFSGSATTAHAVMQFNANNEDKQCKYICVQLPEVVSQTKKDQDYNTIPEIAKERIRRAGRKIKEENPEIAERLDTGFRVFHLDSSNFEAVSKSPEEYNQKMLNLFLDNIKMDRNDLDLLFGALLSWGVPLSLSQPMDTKEVDGCTLYNVTNGELVACFAESITEAVVHAIADLHPERILFRDSCFAEDKEKINIFELLKQQLDWDEKKALDSIRVI